MRLIRLDEISLLKIKNPSFDFTQKVEVWIQENKRSVAFLLLLLLTAEFRVNHGVYDPFSSPSHALFFLEWLGDFLFFGWTVSLLHAALIRFVIDRI